MCFHLALMKILVLIIISFDTLSCSGFANPIHTSPAGSDFPGRVVTDKSFEFNLKYLITSKNNYTSEIISKTFIMNYLPNIS